MKQCAEESNDVPMWRMPLDECYEKDLESNVADIVRFDKRTVAVCRALTLHAAS